MRAHLRLTLRIIVIAVTSLIGGEALLIASRFVVRGHDYSREDTVGVITQFGLPFPFAYDAPGFAWTQFDSTSATWNYWIFVALVASGCLLLQYFLFRSRSIAKQTL